MKQFEFQAVVGNDEKLKIPTDVAAQIEPNCRVRVVVLVPDRTEDQQWDKLTVEQFLQGYSDADAIYDNLPAG